MKVICLFSGGKDSTYAVFWALYQGFDVSLLTVESGDASYMFHKPNIHMTRVQAKLMGLEHTMVKTENERELDDLKKAIAGMKAEGIVTGAVASEYQRERIERIGEELGIPTYSPLWHKKDELLSEMAEHFDIFISAVAAEGLDEHMLGEKFDTVLRKLPRGVHAFFEGGEGETFVAYAPIFSKAIKIKKWRKSWDGVRGSAEVLEYEIV